MKMRHFTMVLGLMLVVSSATIAQKTMDTHAQVVLTTERGDIPEKIIERNKPGVQMTFDTEMIDLGQVKRGEVKEFDFEFTNTGKEDIEIEIVSGCECTTLEWTIKPIIPGAKGVINVSFDSTEKEESETVDVDMTLKNIDPETGYQIFKIVNFKFELVD